jgi:hypothetical protein
VNFSTLTGGSGAFAVFLQAAIWGSGLFGVALALFYRAKRPDIFARIGRRDVAETPPGLTETPLGQPETSSVRLPQ